MKTSGLIVMLASIGSVLALVTYCLYKVLSLPPVEIDDHLRGPARIDPGDSLDAD